MPTITNSPSNSSEVSQILRDTHFQLVSIINEAEQAHCEEACNEEEISQCAQDFLQQTQEEIEAIDERVKDLVEECVTFAEESPFPEIQQLYDVVYEQENYPFIPHKLK